MAHKRALSGANSTRRRSRIIDTLPRLCLAKLLGAKFFVVVLSSSKLPRGRNIAASKAPKKPREQKSGDDCSERDARLGSSKKAPKHRIKLKANSTYGFVPLELNCAKVCVTWRKKNLFGNEKYICVGLFINSFDPFQTILFET